MPVVPLSGDSAELTYGMETLQEVHAPGYPLYLSVGYCLNRFLPFGGPLTSHLVSAVFMTLTLVLFYFYLLFQDFSTPSRWGATILLGFSFTFWNLGTQAEVYSMATFFFMLTLLLSESVLRNGTGRRWLWFVVGLSFTHHPLAIFNLGLAVYATHQDAESIEQLELLLFVLPVVTYALLLFAGSSFPFDWPQVGNLGALLHHVFGGNFTRYFFHEGLLTPFRQLGKVFLAHMMTFPVVMTIVVILGYFYRYNRFRHLIVLQAVMLLVLVCYGIPDLTDFLLPSYCIAGVFLAAGIEQSFQRSQIWGWGLLFVCCISLFIVARGFGLRYDYGNFTFSKKYATEVDRTVSKGVILSDWSHYTLLRYYKLRRNFLPDAQIFPLDLDSEKWSALAKNHMNKGIPVYSTLQDWNPPDPYQLKKNGPVYRLRRVDAQ